MGFRRWLVVGVCFCVFSGCKACQSVYDYCGPMPDEGGDFLYRKNSVLGGDPAMKRMDDKAPDEQGGETDETGPEPTPAPPADEEQGPDMEMEGDRPTLAPDGAADTRGYDDLEGLADDDSDQDLGGEPERGLDNGDLSNNDFDDEEVARAQRGASKAPASTVEWHAPLKKGRSPIRQVQFRDE